MKKFCFLVMECSAIGYHSRPYCLFESSLLMIVFALHYLQAVINFFNLFIQVLSRNEYFIFRYDFQDMTSVWQLTLLNPKLNWL